MATNKQTLMMIWAEYETSRDNDAQMEEEKSTATSSARLLKYMSH